MGVSEWGNMRTVFLVFESKQKSKAEKFLDQYCDRCHQHESIKQWQIDAHQTIDPEQICLYLDNQPLRDDDFVLEEEHALEMWSSLYDPLVFMVNISGKHDGTAELLDFVQSFLNNIPGFVLDDYTEHFWTHEELANHSTFAGHPFFDYIGWYEERKGK